MTELEAVTTDGVPTRRNGGHEGNKNAKLVLEFLGSTDMTRLVRPKSMEKDKDKRKKQTASTYNTMKYHVNRMHLGSKIEVSVRNWEVYLIKK